MPSVGDHQNVRIAPPFGSIDEAVALALKAQVTYKSIHDLPDSSLVLLASKLNPSGQPFGYWVKFTIGVLAVSKVREYESNIQTIPKGALHIHPLHGLLLVTGVIESEYCGDELTYYKKDCIAQVVVPLADEVPRNGFLLGSLRLIRASETESALKLHTELEPY